MVYGVMWLEEGVVMINLIQTLFLIFSRILRGHDSRASCLNFSVTDSLTEELACKYHNHVSFCASRHDPV